MNGSRRQRETSQSRLCLKLAHVLATGHRIPDAEVWVAPRERVSLRALAEEGPVLFLFYLFDWSST